MALKPFSFMPRYGQIYDGDWVWIPSKDFRLACCDCGLIHKMKFRRRAGKLYMQVFRDARGTALSRRRKHVCVKTK